MSAPRVLLISGEYPPLRGGVADYTAELRAALGRIGVRSHVLSSEGAEGEGVSTIGSWSWPVALQVRELARKHPFDIVHIQYQAGAFDMHPAINALPTALTAWLRTPVVTTFHDLRVPYLFPKAGRLRSTVMLRMARASTDVIVTNPGDERILSHAEIESVRIPLGPNLPVPSPSVPKQKETCIGFFGFPSREKGIDELLEAISLFDPHERPKLILVGALRPDTGTHHYLTREDVDRMAAGYGVTLHRTGYLPPQEASDMLASCSIIGLPFTHGASQRSGVLIAALRLGRPVVTTATDVRDDLDTLSDLSQLMTVPPDDVPALHEALRAGIEREFTPEPLPERYEWPSIAGQHRDLYESLMHRRNS